MIRPSKLFTNFKTLSRIFAITLASLLILGFSASLFPGKAEDKLAVTPKKIIEKESIKRDEAGSHERTKTSGSHERPLGKQKDPPSKLVPQSQQRRTSKKYHDVLEATHKSPTAPGSVWDQSYLNSNTPDAIRLKKTIDQYEKGEIGKSVRDFDLNNKTANEIDEEAMSRGFSKKIGGIPRYTDQGLKWARKKGTPTADPNDPEVARQIFYENPDGGMVRVKPDGDPGSERSAPHSSKSVRFDANAGTGWDNEAFKIGSDGNPLPKLPAKDNPEISSTLKDKDVIDTLDAIADATHPYLKENK